MECSKIQGNVRRQGSVASHRHLCFCTVVNDNSAVSQIRIVLVYMKTGNNNETKEYNKKIIKEIGQILEGREIQQKATIVLGDFNGHLGSPLKRT